MSFHEKSAWVMGAVMALGTLFYFYHVVQMSAAMGEIAPPVLPLIILYVVVIVIASIAGHIAVAISKPSEADDMVDERDRIIFDRASARGGVSLGIGVMVALLYYLTNYNGFFLFHAVFGSMMVAQIVEYAWRIVQYRRGV